jgi:predicted RNase H-like HicB family nuclease
MAWSREAKLNHLMRLHWTIKREQDSDEGYVILRVAELPSVIATGDPSDKVALENDFWEALQATLESALQFGDPIPVPEGVRLPWEHPVTPTPLRNVAVQDKAFTAFVPQPKQTGSGARTLPPLVNA